MTNKKPIVILGAMDGEIKAFLKSSHIRKEYKWNDFTFYEAKLENLSVVISKSGVGKVLSSMVTQKLIDLYDPKAIICTGIAGSVNRDITIGHIVVGFDSVQHDFDAREFNFKLGEIPYTNYRFIKSDDLLYEKAMTFKSNESKVFSGRVLTGDQFVTNYEGENELNGDCVEMEGSAIALVATVNKIPHLIIRTISDDINHKKLNLKKILTIASYNSLNMVKHIFKEY